MGLQVLYMSPHIHKAIPHRPREEMVECWWPRSDITKVRMSNKYEVDSVTTSQGLICESLLGRRRLPIN